MSKHKVKKKTPRLMPDVSEYIRLYKEQNYPIRDIAKHFQVAISTVYNAMVAAGFNEFRPKHSRLSHSRMSKEEQAIALYQSGMTRTAVVQKLNISAKTLNKVLMLRGRNSCYIPAMLDDRGWHGGTAPTPNLNYSGRGNPSVVALLC